MKDCLHGWLLLLAACGVGGALTLATPAFAEEKVVMSYGVDLASNYVSRGSDLFEGVFTAAGDDPASFQFVPVVQPSVTFPGEGGFSLGLWGSFALTERAPEDADLAALDEFDITLSQSWENSMGGFDAGLVVYNLVNPNGGANSDEIYFSWSLPFMAAIGPSLTHYAPTNGEGQYTAFGFGGGEGFSWSLNIGLAKNGIQDITVGAGMELGAISIAANIANRPKLELHGDPDVLPGNIIWLVVSYGGEVTE